MTNELALTGEGFDTTNRVASAMVASGYFGDVKETAQAIVKIMAGQEMGLGPYASMSGIHIIKGKPVLGANLIATIIKNSGRYDYRVTKHDNAVCEIVFYEHGEQVGVSSFSVDDAKKAGLNNPNWSKFPRNMVFARAMSNGAKWYVPGVFGGAAVYTEGELDAPITTPAYVAPAKSQPAAVDAEYEEEEPMSIRDKLENATNHNLGVVCTMAEATGLYKDKKHAMNAIKSYPFQEGKAITKFVNTQKVSKDGALLIFDWLMERKEA